MLGIHRMSMLGKGIKAIPDDNDEDSLVDYKADDYTKSNESEYNEGKMQGN